MKKFRLGILGFLLVFIVLYSYAEILEKIFVLDVIIYKNDSAGLLNFRIAEGKPTEFLNISSNYTLRVISTENEILLDVPLTVVFTMSPMVPPGIDDYEVELNESLQYLRLPYFSNADRIEIYHRDKLIFKQKIIWCDNNGICESTKNENYANCPKDCPSGSLDGYCDRVKDGICDPDCKADEDIDCKIPTTTTTSTTTTTKPTRTTTTIKTTTTLRSITTTTQIITTTTLRIICGNGLCGSGENYANCPNDCKSGSNDNYCDGVKDKICDPDCKKEEDEDCRKIDIGYISSIAPFFIAVTVIVLILLYITYKKIKGKKIIEKEKKERELIERVKEKLREGEDPKILKEGLEKEGINPEIVDKAIEHLW